ncbi:MAG: phosphopentomutase [Acutalibacteraceae bacterium]
MFKRIFLIVLDSFGIGALPDAALYGDEDSNTLRSCSLQEGFALPNMRKLGLFNIDGVSCGEKAEKPMGAYGRLAEKSAGKDTTIGHWEICGLISPEPLPTYPHGFPQEIIEEFTGRTGRGILCNQPYSGTDVIRDYGKEHMETGKLIVYTSADSVFQIAAHEDIISRQELYEYCRIAREILQGKHGVGRVIARPFAGEYPNFYRTTGRHDFSLAPTGKTLIDELAEHHLDVIPVGKIYDIFAGRNLSESHPTAGNAEGMAMTAETALTDFHGLCFTNLVDFDMLYGHRNDPKGYAAALIEFDRWLGSFLSLLRADDVLFITADHGCDPITESTDHSREYVPLLIYGEKIKSVNLGTRDTFADIGKTIADSFGVGKELAGKSFLSDITKE